MFGVRHSSLLTSNDYIAEEANAFRAAISQAKLLRFFSWLTPQENVNFVGFSVAVVDLAFEPLIEGLEVAALDMDSNGHRVKRHQGDTGRYRHPLEEVTLHHCIFPSNRGRQFFHLFTKSHPDDSDCLLFPRLSLINVKKAINVDPTHVALLALFWQLRVEADSAGQRIEHQDWDPAIVLEDVFVNSIWGPRLTEELLKENMARLVDDALTSVEEAKQASHNPYIRSLEESVDLLVKLDEKSGQFVRAMAPWQREGLIHKASKRVTIAFVEGFIAGHQ